MFQGTTVGPVSELNPRPETPTFGDLYIWGYYTVIQPHDAANAIR